MELWGGHECTVNRVGDRFRDQTRLTGHQDRPQDLARFADLGIRKLRYPVIWERVAPDHPGERDWRWSDERLAEIGRLGLQPILGLLHHGSGPRYTSLVADNFVELFGDFAGAVARRYPWVMDWTPINEPLTTARFSALYGLWYPHARDEALFWRAVLNQIDGTRAAMKAIRRANPAARLIQTEDLGQYHATEELASAAAHLNHRRWATWDLLAGRVTPDHALWPYLVAFGLGDRLRAIADDPCPPDVIGVNHYPTSERFIDHRLDAYPDQAPPEGYHDLAALRVLDPPPPGLRGMLRQAWDRYRLPLAVTEAHLGCSREEQLRWLWQSWRACRDLAADGVDMRALTAWALLGNVDWNSLITRDDGHYETGAFDVRGGVPRPTAIARLLTVLGHGQEPVTATFPTLAGAGWWQRDVRLEHAPFAWPGPASAPPETGAPPLLIAGAAPVLAQAFSRECEMRGLPHVVAGGAALPVGDAERAAACLEEHRPWAVIHAGRLPSFEAGTFRRADGDGLSPLAKACEARGIKRLVFRSDLVSAATSTMLVIRPASRPDLQGLVRACLDLLVDGERGEWCVTDGVAVPIAGTEPPTRAVEAASAPGEFASALVER